MAVDQRDKNSNWNTRSDSNVYLDAFHYKRASLATLMDIRDELQTLNRLLGCHNFIRVPSVLDAIRTNTAKPRQKRKAKAAA